MLPLILVVLAQAANPDADADKLLVGIHGLMNDPFKNAEEIDRRLTAAKKLVDENAEFKRRDMLSAWVVQMGRKTGRSAEVLGIAKERLKSKSTPIGGLYYEALQTAVLAMKSEEVVALLRGWAKEEPSFLQNRERMEKDAARLGRAAPSVSTTPVEGTKFSWSSGTRDKIVVLYFTASW